MKPKVRKNVGVRHPVLLLLAMAMFPVSSASGSIVAFDLVGEFGFAGPFGGTGLEQGSFSGSFSYDTDATDLIPGDPQGGRYDLSSWDIDLFFSTSSFAGEMISSDGGTGQITVIPDGTLAGFNFALELTDDGGLPTDVSLGLFFDLSIPSISPPMDPSGAAFDSGVFFLPAGLPDAPATFVEDAHIASQVPLPGTIWLLASGMVAFAVRDRVRKFHSPS